MSTFKTDDDLSLYFEDSGPQDAPAVICLPGLTRDGQDFRYLRPHLSEYRAIYLDPRGRGRSQYATDYTTYNVFREAMDVIALMDHLNLEHAALIGTSRGGLVAMCLAATAKHRLSAIILNDVGPDLDSTGLERIYDYLGRRPAAKTHIQAAKHLERALGQDFPNLPQERWLEDARVFYDATESGLALRYDPKLRDAFLEQAAAVAELPEQPSLWPWFQALDGLPSAVIRAENSDILSQKTYNQMQEKLLSLKAIELPDRGHIPYLDEPEAITLIHDILIQITRETAA